MTGRSELSLTTLSDHDVGAPSAAIPPAGASTALLVAAIGGLLCLSSGCGDDPEPQEGEITLSRVDPEVTQEAFEKACMMVDGKIEVHPHCGGVNSCKGFSYDTDTSVYTEHTCRGLNTCTGYSCVVPEEKG